MYSTNSMAYWTLYCKFGEVFHQRHQNIIDAERTWMDSSAPDQ